MPHTALQKNQRRQTDFTLTFGLTAVLLFFVASGLVSYWNTRILSRDAALVSNTHEVITALDNLLSVIKDAETGQRGYVLTGDEKYLAPYTAAITNIDERLSDVERLVRDDPNQTARLPGIKIHIHAKLAELAETVLIRRTRGFDEARTVVVTDRGKNGRRARADCDDGE
jgi:CHASE3 domain sensor protein